MNKHFTILLLAFLSATALQSQEQIHVTDKQVNNKRWHTSTFGSLAFGNSWFNGGSFTTFSAPVGVQLTRQLNKNLYAFGKLSAVPAYFNFSSSFNGPVLNKMGAGNGLFGSGHFSIYPRAEAGLFYINDERTFSISGSLSIDRTNTLYYPFYSTGNGASRSFR